MDQKQTLRTALDALATQDMSTANLAFDKYFSDKSPEVLRNVLTDFEAEHKPE